MMQERQLATEWRMGRYPAVVRSYDSASRTCEVEIPGVTDGAEALLVAEIEYPIGDDSRLTEREMLAGDLVWVTFIAGDSRYPLITGYRNPRVGNVGGIRRLHQQTVKVLADGSLHLQGATVRIEGGSVDLNGTVKINGIVQVGN